MTWWRRRRVGTEDVLKHTVGGNLIFVDRTGGDATVVVEGLQAPPPVPPGRPVTEHDPFELEVHEAIAVPGDLPPLPEYVRRAHDDMLDGRVRGAVAGRSGAVFLVGESSTGKTRAAWEAVQKLPGPWVLWHPAEATTLLRGLDAVAPHTVIWLDDAHHHLLTIGDDLGERAAVGLRALLRDADRRPVLVLGTIWPRPWQRLTAPQTAADGHDPHGHARVLLSSHAVTVPAAFTDHDLQALRPLARHDARLAEAAARAEQGRVVQFLAGAPALLERYRTATAEVQALIECAIDARRVGYGTALPRTLLEQAALDYLAPAQRDLLAAGWADGAFAQVSQPVRGIRGPLSVVAHSDQPDQCDQGEKYQLADYLEQTGRVTRHATLPPPRLWEALVEHADPQTLLAIAASAGDRGLLRLAVRIYTHAADAGASLGRLQISRLMSSAGRELEAAQWARAAAEAGEPGAQQQVRDLVWQVAGRLDYTSRAAEADRDYWLGFGHPEDEHDVAVYQALGGDAALEETQRARRAADATKSRTNPWAAYAEPPSERPFELPQEIEARMDEQLSIVDGVPDDMVEERLVENGLVADDAPYHWKFAGRCMWRRGREEAGLALIRRGADLGDSTALSWAADLLRDPEAFKAWLAGEADDERVPVPQRFKRALLTGRHDTALRWWLEALRQGEPLALSQVEGILRTQQDADMVVDWCGQAIRAGAEDLAGLAGIAAHALQAASRHEEAAAWYRQAIEAGDDDCVERLAGLVTETGAGTEQVEWLRRRAEAGDSVAAAGIATMHLMSGRRDQALLWLQERGVAGDVHSLRSAVRLLADDGQEAEAMALFRRLVETAASRRADRLAKVSAERADHVESLQPLLLHEVDALYPLHEAAHILKEMGRSQEAERLHRYGWNTDGSIASPWEAHP